MSTGSTKLVILLIPVIRRRVSASDSFSVVCRAPLGVASCSSFPRELPDQGEWNEYSSLAGEPLSTGETNDAIVSTCVEGFCIEDKVLCRSVSVCVPCRAFSTVPEGLSVETKRSLRQVGLFQKAHVIVSSDYLEVNPVWMFIPRCHSVIVLTSQIL